MTDTTQTQTFLSAETSARPAEPAARAARRPPGYLFSPWVDFFCLGGGSVVILALVAVLLPTGIPTTQQAALITVLMLLVNQPHFAQSYQIFYAHFRAKAFGAAYTPALRARYIIAGLVVPAALIGFFAVALATSNPRLLARGANLMFFLVGWHYVKQGYGILMVDSAKKGIFFGDSDKWLLRANGYASWIVAWMAVNRAVRAEAYLGLTYFTFNVPTPVYYAAVAVAALTTAGVAALLVREGRKNGRLPWNGVVAYLATLYLWVIFVRINPLIFAVVPTFHSLQYQIVVWRYQWNASATRPPFARRSSANSTRLRFGSFMLIAFVLGWLGFYGLPTLFNGQIPYDRALFGPSLFTFLFYIFINVHHYFLDNVMWRRENPDVRKYVFSRA